MVRVSIKVSVRYVGCRQARQTENNGFKGCLQSSLGTSQPEGIIKQLISSRLVQDVNLSCYEIL